MHVDSDSATHFDNVELFPEEALGADFSDVHVHSRAEAALDAKAFTEGDGIVFEEQQSDSELLTHELEHVQQQSQHNQEYVGTDISDSDASNDYNEPMGYIESNKAENEPIGYINPD